MAATPSTQLDAIVASGDHPVELRVKALELLAQEEQRAEAAKSARFSNALEILRLLISPAVIVAAIGIATAFISGVLEREKDTRDAANTEALASLEGEIDARFADQAAVATLNLEDRKFQFEAIRVALSDSKVAEERAATLAFLTEVGILEGLNLEALLRWATREDLSSVSFESQSTPAVVRSHPRGPVDESLVSDLRAEAVESGTERWMDIAIGELGVRELAGPDTSADVAVYFEEFGLSWADENPWSSFFVGWVLRRAGFDDLPSNIGLNRSWLKWGTAVAEPQFGALAVFWRQSPDSILGTAGFIVGHNDQSITILGGNVNQQVGVVTLPRDRLLGVRLPPSSQE